MVAVNSETVTKVVLLSLNICGRHLTVVAYVGERENNSVCMSHVSHVFSTES